jgi:hypothetical protein
LLSRQAELAHRRLAEYHWQTGGWVRARSRFGFVLARCPRKAWVAVVAELAQTGWQYRAGQLVNADVAALRTEALASCRRFSALGRKAAQHRWRAEPPTASPQEKAECPRHAHGNAHGMPTAMRPQCARNATTVHDQDSKSTSLAFTAERSTLSGSALKNRAAREKHFLASVKATMSLWNAASGKTELINWGGWWRQRFREDPDKAQRILNEVLCLIREQRITSSPGAAATDLWKRLP